MAPPQSSPNKRRRTEQSSLTSFFKPAQSSPAKNEDEESTNVKTEAANGHPDNAKSPPVAVAAAAATTTSDSTNDPMIPQPVASRNARWGIYQDAVLYRRAPARAKVAGLDLDGTLLQWRTGTGWPSCREHYELWNSTTVIPKLRHLYDHEGYGLTVFSNQGAIRSAFDGKKATLVKSLVDWLAVIIDRPLSAVMSTSKKTGYHKPSPLMWKKVLQNVLGGGHNVADSFFVGDSVDTPDDPQGGVDVGFAKNVGTQLGTAPLKFYTPTEFFGPSSMQLRSASTTTTSNYYEPPSRDVLQTRAALLGGYCQVPIMLLMCGAQGSGKSTFSAKLLADNDEHWVHVSQDTIQSGKPGSRACVERAAAEALQQGRSVVVDRMHLDETQRAYFLQVAAAAAAANGVAVPVHTVVLTPPTRTLTTRVQQRQPDQHAVHGPEGAQLASQSAQKLVPPTYREGFALMSASRTEAGVARLVQLYRRVGLVDSSKNVRADTASANDWSSSLVVPPITLGTMGLGRRAAQEAVTMASQLGFASFDTAPTYKNEDKVGAGLINDNKSFCIVKVPKRATTPEQVRQELVTSLANLTRPCADLLLLHWPSDVIAAGTLQDVWSEMEKLVKEGLARKLGVCNFSAQALCMLLPYCTAVRPVVNQVERHPLLPQWEVMEFCAQNDIVVQAHTPLGQGRDEVLDHAVVKQVASKYECSPAQVVLQWNLQQGVSVVPKCSSKKHMEEVLSISFQLSAEDMRALNEIEATKRFVAPFFMYGSEPYCWGRHAPK